MWSERIINICFFSGVAPVYKPGNLATGQYPQTDAGYLASDHATAFCEYRIFPNYEFFTNDEQARYNMLYELKVDASGRTGSPLVRTAKWKIFSARPGESLLQSAAGSGCAITIQTLSVAEFLTICSMAEMACSGPIRRPPLLAGWRCGNRCCRTWRGAEI